jgi:hypothetical protein
MGDGYSAHHLGHTYILSRGMEEDTSHPISFLGERLADKLPILLAASPHPRV